MRQNSLIFVVFAVLFAAGLITQGLRAEIVSKESVEKQRRLTTRQTLSNGIPLIIRHVPGSDILALRVSYHRGWTDVPLKDRVGVRWAFASMTRGAEGFSKQKIYETAEKYAINMSCAASYETSGCSLETVNDYWKVALPMFAAIISKPTFDKTDAMVEKQRLEAEFRSAPQNPEAYVNEIANRGFYTADFPYRLDHEDALMQLASTKPQQLSTIYKQFLNAQQMALIVVTSLTDEDVKVEMERAFGKIKGSKFIAQRFPKPKYDPKTAYQFEARDIPTAYLQIKFNGIEATDPDAYATMLMFAMLDEDLTEEVRTKRSLSYSIYSQDLRNRIGIAAIGASTSKPEATLHAIMEVVEKFKGRTYSRGEVDEHRNVFATHFYLNQETHAALAANLAQNFYYFHSTDPFYDMPLKLAAITPEDIQRVAQKLLKNMRVGVIFARAKFQDSWAKEFIKKSGGKI